MSKVTMCYDLPIVAEDTFLEIDFPREYDFLYVDQGTGMLHLYVLQKYTDANSSNYESVMRATRFIWRAKFSKASLDDDAVFIGAWTPKYLDHTNHQHCFILGRQDPTTKILGELKRQISVLQGTVCTLEKQLNLVQ
jgi:hypothetical protein